MATTEDASDLMTPARAGATATSAAPAAGDVLDGAEEAGWMAYQRTQARLSGVMAREMTEATGLSEADFQVLSALADSESGRMRAIGLRCAMDWEKSRLSHQLRRMEERGLVRREPCPNDARGAVVYLTDAGRDVGRSAACVRARSVRTHLIEPLGPERFAQLAGMVQDLGAGLQERLGDCNADAAMPGGAAPDACSP